MHEHVYVDDIVKEARRHGKVKVISLEVGELAPISPEDLVHALAFTGWAVKTKQVKGFIHCHCGFRGAPTITERTHDTVVYECPKCAAQLPRIVGGKDVVLKDVTVSE
jgi:Zn finger protein HypA/HybF involved in hydrogenase expression